MRFFLTYKYIFIFFSTVLFVRILGYWTFFIEHIYIPIYNLFASCLRGILNKINFSVGDWLYVFVLFYLIYKSIQIIKTKNKPKGFVVNAIFKSLTIIYILFNVMWSFSINRISLAEKLNLRSEYTTEELVKVTHILTERLNRIHLKYTKNENKELRVPYNLESVFKTAPEGYYAIKDIHEDFTYLNPTVKTSVFSKGLTYMGFSGYLNPFTNEAQINGLMPINNTLVTASHEIAHQIGIVPENEANFLGYLAAKHNPNLYYDYAATSFALRYCLKRYPFKNEEEFIAYLENINPGIRRDWERTKKFWETHQTFIDTFFKFVYDSFLKVNKQEFGMEGYSKFLDYLIAYELNKKG